MARRREIRLQALARRAGEIQREHELDVARAATAERARIARDIHDILAHAVSLMVVQAEAGPVVVRANPDAPSGPSTPSPAAAATRWSSSAGCSACSRARAT
jgi:hypothetical protein